MIASTIGKEEMDTMTTTEESIEITISDVEESDI